MSFKDQVKKIASAPKRKAAEMMKNFILVELKAKIKKKHLQKGGKDIGVLHQLSFAGKKDDTGKNRGQCREKYVGIPEEIKYPMTHEDVVELLKISPTLKDSEVKEITVCFDFVLKKIYGTIMMINETESKSFEY